MLARSIRPAAAVALLVLSGTLLAADKKEEAVVQPVVITEKDKGPVRVKVGTEFEVRLVSDRVATGWSGGVVSGASVVRIKEKIFGFVEFTPDKNATDESIGTYHFRFKAAIAGNSELGFVFMQPGGPTPRPARGVQRIREFTVKIEVTE